MPSSALTGPISSWLASVDALVKRFLALATEEGKQAGLRLVSMLGLALLAALLAITGWLALLAGIVVALVQNDIVSWGVALALAALLSFAGAGGLALMVLRRSRQPLFAATRRQLGSHRKLETDGGEGMASLVPHEQQVEDGRMAVAAEYQRIRYKLRRRLGSPLIIGGVVLAGIAVGYLARSRWQANDPHGRRRPGVWTQVIGSVQVLTPLITALHLATRPQASAAKTAESQLDGEDKATAGKRHGS